MFERNKVLSDFRREVLHRVKIVRDYISEGNQKEAFEWFADLLEMRRMFMLTLKLPNVQITFGSIVDGHPVAVDTGITDSIDRAKIGVLTSVIEKLDAKFKRKGWKYQAKV
jgi:hypothetical protein|tara:strand:- start:232 stop:564 length:333 start_codon:yes stop_codon:yes gene_type:complete